MTKIEAFQTELQQFVRTDAGLEGEEASLASTFTDFVLEQLVESGDISNPISSEVLSDSGRYQAAAIDWDSERLVLTFFVTSYAAQPGISSMTKAELTPHFSRIQRFASACRDGLFHDLDQSTEVYDAARFIYDIWSLATTLRFVLLTNAALRTSLPTSSELDGKKAKFEVWDLDRIERLVSSGKAQEPLDVLVSQYGSLKVQALGPFGDGEGYEAYLLVLPGQFLADIYEEFGPRLLELNVRSFLQTRNKTNKGMQDSLRLEPERFLAYNNGLSMTASGLETSLGENGIREVTRLKDLQIVNGGQTTASLYHAAKRLNVSLDSVLVQAKLTVLSEVARAEWAPRISQFANTQNPIRMADFSANDPFHVELEKLSRSIWAPAINGSGQMTRWFYERARGQYADALAREKTPAQKRAFSANHPKSQMFAKTDVAKYEQAWAQLPYLVALGNEKNFNEFSQRMKDSKQSQTPDATYFQRLIAKAIVWKSTESQIKAMNLGGYRSAAVAYTVALISNRTAMKVDIDAVWRAQQTSEVWKAVVSTIAPLVQAKLISSAGNRNVLEWAKKKECWTAIQEIVWTPSPQLISASKPDHTRSTVASSVAETSLPASNEEIAGRKLISAMGASVWFDLAGWSKQTDNLQAWQRGLAGSIGSYLAQDRPLSEKQVTQGVKIALEASRLGFEINADAKQEIASSLSK